MSSSLKRKSVQVMDLTKSEESSNKAQKTGSKKDEDVKRFFEALVFDFDGWFETWCEEVREEIRDSEDIDEAKSLVTEYKTEIPALIPDCISTFCNKHMDGKYVLSSPLPSKDTFVTAFLDVWLESYREQVAAFDVKAFHKYMVEVVQKQLVEALCKFLDGALKDEREDDDDEEDDDQDDDDN